MAKEIILGIDLGTTNSVVSYLQADGTVKVIPNPEGTVTTPSVVAFKANGEEIKPSQTQIQLVLLRELWVVRKRSTLNVLTNNSLHKKSPQRFLLT